MLIKRLRPGRNLLLCALVLTVNACGAPDEDPALSELLRDPLSAREQAGAVLVVAEDTAAGQDGLFSSKPHRTRVLRAFAPSGGSVEDLDATLREQALSAGWDLEADPAGVGTRGTRTMGFGVAELFLAVGEVSEEDVVTISLTPGGVDG